MGLLCLCIDLWSMLCEKTQQEEQPQSTSGTADAHSTCTLPSRTVSVKLEIFAGLLWTQCSSRSSGLKYDIVVLWIKV